MANAQAVKYFISGTVPWRAKGFAHQALRSSPMVSDVLADGVGNELKSRTSIFYMTAHNVACMEIWSCVGVVLIGVIHMQRRLADAHVPGQDPAAGA